MKILALDDEKNSLKMLERVIRLAEPAAELMCTTDYDAALLWAQEQNPDITFLDIEMQGLSGLNAARELKRMNPRVNIIFVTGYSQYAMEAISLHSSGYILKPADATDIRRELDNLLYPAKTTPPPRGG